MGFADRHLFKNLLRQYTSHPSDTRAVCRSAPSLTFPAGLGP